MLPRPESSLCAVLELTLIDPVAKLLLKKEKKKSPVLYSEMYALVLLYSYWYYYLHSQLIVTKKNQTWK